MTSYFLDDKPDRNGVRKVRSAFCPHLPDFYGRIFLGDFECIEDASRKAEQFHFPTGDCAVCRITSSARASRVDADAVG